MERTCNRMMTRIVWIVFVLFLFSGFSDGIKADDGEEEYSCRFYEAYVTGDMTKWPVWMEQLKEKYKTERDDEVLSVLVKAYYGYVAYLIGIEKEEKAKTHINEAEKYISMLKVNPSHRSYAEAIHGAFIAFKIGLNKAKAIYLGPKSIRHINKSIELNPRNPYAWVEKGNAEYHMPRYLGGSYESAAGYFDKAVSLFESQNRDIKCNWVYMNALAWLAQSHTKAGNTDKAKTVYRKILKLEPDFKWVRDELYPDFMESLEENL